MSKNYAVYCECSALNPLKLGLYSNRLIRMSLSVMYLPPREQSPHYSHHLAARGSYRVVNTGYSPISPSSTRAKTRA